MRRAVNDYVPWTCPQIDEVIRVVKNTMAVLQEMDDPDIVAICNNLEYVESYMEDIRSDNSDLRSYAQAYGDEANEFEERIEELEDTLARKDEQILALEEKVFDAEKEIANAQYLYQPVWSNG